MCGDVRRRVDSSARKCRSRRPPPSWSGADRARAALASSAMRSRKAVPIVIVEAVLVGRSETSRPRPGIGTNAQRHHARGSARRRQTRPIQDAASKPTFDPQNGTRMLLASEIVSLSPAARTPARRRRRRSPQAQPSATARRTRASARRSACPAAALHRLRAAAPASSSPACRRWRRSPAHGAPSRRRASRALDALAQHGDCRSTSEIAARCAGEGELHPGQQLGVLVENSGWSARHCAMSVLASHLVQISISPSNTLVAGPVGAPNPGAVSLAACPRDDDRLASDLHRAVDQTPADAGHQRCAGAGAARQAFRPRRAPTRADGHGGGGGPA